MSSRTRRYKLKGERAAFLFINEDPHTVTHKIKDPLRDLEKQSHVQWRTSELKRLGQQQQQAQTTDPNSQPSRVDEINSGVSTESIPDALFPLEPQDPAPDLLVGLGGVLVQPPSVVQTPHLSTSTDIQSLDPAVLQHHDSVSITYRPGHFLDDTAQRITTIATQGSVQQYHDASLRSPLRARNVYPLFSGRFQVLEKWAPLLIQYHNTVCLPEKFYADTLKVPLGQIRHASAIHADMQDVMSEPAHLYSFLASAVAQMLNREGRLLLPDLSLTDRQAALIFKTKAIEAVRHLLERGVITHRLVLDVHCLISNAYFSHAYEAADPHFEAMISMIRSLGGIRTFNEYFRESTILLHWSVGLKKLAPAKLPLDFDPGRGSRAVASTLEQMKGIRADIGIRLRNLCEDMPQPLAEAALQHLEALRLHCWCRRNTVYDPQYYRWLSFRRLAIGYRLLSIPPFADIQDECFRIGLIFWTALTRCPASGQRCGSLQAHTLRARLQASDLGSLWGYKTDLLLWIAIIGATTSRAQMDVEWFAGIAVQAASKLGVDFSITEDVEMALMELLYDPLLQRKAVKTMTGIRQGGIFIGTDSMQHR